MNLVSFTDNYTRFTIVYTIRIKNKWLSTLQRYYNQIYTKFNLKITRIYTNYRIELYSKKATAQIDNLGIEFRPTALYAQEENRVVERSQRTSTKITRLIILASNILDFLQPNILLIAIYIKNRRPIRALSGILPTGSRIYYLLPYSKRRSRKISQVRSISKEGYSNQL